MLWLSQNLLLYHYNISNNVIRAITHLQLRIARIVYIFFKKSCEFAVISEYKQGQKHDMLNVKSM